MKFYNLNHGRRAFSLMELLVVITIIAILAAILMPTIKMVRDAALAASCLSNLHQIHMGIEIYSQDFDALPPTANNWGFPSYPHAMAATYLESGKGDSDGNKPKDVLKCPGDRRRVESTDDAISHHSVTADTLMQCMWSSDSTDHSSIYGRMWSSYCSNHTVFTGTSRRMTATIGLFWDSWTFTSIEAWSVPGTARHKRNTNIVYGDGHAGAITSSFMQPGRAWNLAPWAGAGIVVWPDPVSNIGTSYPAEYTNINGPPWKEP